MCIVEVGEVTVEGEVDKSVFTQVLKGIQN